MFAVPDEYVAGMIPRAGFIRSYVEWAYSQTDAPSVFHAGVAINLLATIAHPDYGYWGSGAITPPNVYTLLVGLSGTSRKSWAISAIGNKLLQEVVPERSTTHAASYPALLEQLYDEPTQCVVDEDIARFLKDAKGTGYLSSLKQGYMPLYDNPSNLRLPRSMKNADVGGPPKVIAKPRLSILAGANMTELSDHLDRGDLSSGFMSRWMILSGKRVRTLDPAKTPDHREIRAGLVNALGYYLREAISEPIPFDPQAGNVIATWEASLDQILLTSEDVQETSLLSRLPTFARKVSVLYALDRILLGYYQRRTPIKRVLLDDVAPAMRFIEAVHASTASLYRCLYTSGDMRDRAKVLSVMPGGTPVSTGYISEKAQMLKPRVLMLLDTLEGEDYVQKVLDVKGTKWVKIRAAVGEAPIARNVDQPQPAIPPATPAIPQPHAADVADDIDGDTIVYRLDEDYS